jgi:Zn-dependent peptidase ImmA (M78 family)/transcriptional regulator with XRE-family HTH domain
MSIYGERIRQARELAGMTQEELAGHVGISQSMVAHIETGRVSPSLDVIQAIAKETEVQASFFEQIPMADIPNSLAYRARSSLRSSERDKAYQYAKVCIEQFQQMSLKLNLPDFKLPSKNLDAVTLARLLRVMLGIEPTKPVPHLINTLEQNGVIVIAMPFGLEKLDAFSCWSNTGRPIIVVSTQKPGDRLRFSVAHELGHIVLHKDTHKLTVVLEKEANAFAGEFLLPEIAMRGTLSPALSLTQAARLKLRWGVSMQMLIKRAHELNIITERRYHYLFEQIGRMGWKTKEPDNLDIPVEKPRAFKKMVELLYGNNDGFVNLASAMHITDRLAERILNGYAHNSQVKLGDTEEYISSRQNLNLN